MGISEDYNDARPTADGRITDVKDEQMHHDAEVDEARLKLCSQARVLSLFLLVRVVCFDSSCLTTRRLLWKWQNLQMWSALFPSHLRCLKRRGQFQSTIAVG